MTRDPGRRRDTDIDEPARATSRTFRVESPPSLLEVEARRGEDTTEQRFSSSLRMEVRCVADGIWLRKSVEVTAGEITRFGAVLRKLGNRTSDLARLGRSERVDDDATIALWRSSDTDQLFIDVRITACDAQYTVALRGMPLTPTDLDRMILWCTEAVDMVVQPIALTGAATAQRQRR